MNEPPRIPPSVIRELRKKLGLNQIQFADRLAVHQSTVSKWETGRAKPEHAEYLRLQKLLDEVMAGQAESPPMASPPLHSIPTETGRTQDRRWLEQVGAIIEDELAAAKVTLSVSQRFELLATISRAVERIGELINSGVPPEAAMRHVRDAIGEENDVGT